jgi:hypothetical protein
MVAYSFKHRFVDPIRRGLDSAYPDQRGVRPKRQTIRADRKRHARPGEIIQLYHGMRTKHCFLIGQARCVSIFPIRLSVGTSSIVMNNRVVTGDFARADGFDGAVDMLEFWKNEHGIGHWSGVIIKWEPL